MSKNGKSGQFRAFDASFILAMILTAAFYVVMYLPSMRVDPAALHDGAHRRIRDRRAVLSGALSTLF